MFSASRFSPSHTDLVADQYLPVIARHPMPRGKTLTPLERGQTAAYADEGRSSAWISRKLNRSRTVIQNYLRSPSTYATAKRSGRKRKMSERSERQLLREASNSAKSARQLQLSLNLPISASRTRAYLNNTVFLKYRKAKQAPPLTKDHKERRKTWAIMHVTFNKRDWGKLLFSDEKRFNLDGPDGLHSYWHDLRCEEKVLSRRQNGGGGIMVWGGISVHGRTNLVVLKGRQATGNYLKTMEEYLLPFTDDNMPVEWIYQQDNAPIHVSSGAKEWFVSNGVRLMKWPARSPDLNPIENVWGWLARKVYAENRQFATEQELTDCVLGWWDRMPQELVNNLIYGMSKRAVEVLERQGGSTHY